jgi:hypothetical protein
LPLLLPLPVEPEDEPVVPPPIPDDDEPLVRPDMPEEEPVVPPLIPDDEPVVPPDMPDEFDGPLDPLVEFVVRPLLDEPGAVSLP